MMSEKPVNRVKVDGEDVYGMFGMVLSDDYVIGIPEYKRYTVDILGDGVVDVTEAGGDVFFAERTITLPFFVPEFSTQREYEAFKSQVAGWIHGRKCEMQFAVDPGFTYEGRVKACQFTRDCKVACCTLEVEAKPYKTMGRVMFKANAAGGIRLRLDNGRAKTQPTIEVYRKSVISYEGRSWTLDPGTWVLDDLWFHYGANILAVTTTPEYGYATLEDYKDTILADIADKMLCELAAGDSPLQIPMTLEEVGELCTDLTKAAMGDAATPSVVGTLWPIGDVRLIDLSYPATTDSDEYKDTNIYVEYEWRDL